MNNNVTLCLAIDVHNGGIAKDGFMPWEGKLTKDLEFLRGFTRDRKVIMGRKTYDHMINNYPKFIKNRDVQVLSRSSNLPNITDKAVCIFGGAKTASFYLEQDLIDNIILTWVSPYEVNKKGKYIFYGSECDTFINLDMLSKFTEVSSGELMEENGYVYQIIKYSKE